MTTRLFHALLLGHIGTLCAPAAETWIFEAAASDDSPAAEIVHGDPAATGPFVVAFDVPEGNYRVTVDLAAQADPAPVTVKAESRRLMIERFTPPAGEDASLAFAVNVRTPALAGGGEVALNDREIGTWHWDDRLQLELHAAPGVVARIAVEPAPDLPTVYLAGDSTVTAQHEEPWVGWGQMLPRFFGPGLVVANHAESRLAPSSFFAHRRSATIPEALGPGDYLFVQFGHNDMKERGEGIGPWQSYRAALERVVRETRAQGATPVLLTSMQRRRFDDQYRQFATLGDYPLVVRRVAADLGVPLIDLNQMSATLYAALGPEGSKRAFVHYPAGTFPGQEKPLKDDTHFNPYGGYQLARSVVEGIRLALPDLATQLREDVGPYDPASPDPFAAVEIPPSPRASFDRPLGD